MNRMWSVLTAPCLVATVVPSISGSRSRCTPSRLTSAPPRCSLRPQILSISSRKTMPFCSTAAIASRTTCSWSSSLSLSSAISTRWLSATVMLARLGAAAEGLAEHVAEIEHAHLRAGHAGDLEGRQARRRAVLHLRSRSRGRRAAPSRSILRNFWRVSALALAPTSASSTRSSAASSALALDLLAQPLAGHRDRDLDEVADDLLDIAADIADLGELGRLDLEERRLRELRQAARDLGLADAGRADHQDVLRQHLLAQLVAAAAGGASGCAARWRRRAWRRPGRRCSGRARRRSRAG